MQCFGEVDSLQTFRDHKGQIRRRNRPGIVVRETEDVKNLWEMWTEDFEIKLYQ